MPADSTGPGSPRKSHRPGKPRKDFPLYAHKIGRWAKKVRGDTKYFTRWADDPKGVAALEQWLREKDDLLAGREPKEPVPDALALGDLCNEFLDAKKDAREAGELSPRTWRGYYDTCERLVKAFGRNQSVAALEPADLRKYRAKLSKTLGLVALGNEIQRVRSIFLFAFDEGKIPKPVPVKRAFAKPNRKAIRLAREAHRAVHGDRMFEAADIRKILADAGQPLRTMVLLAANCAFGQSDLAALPIRAVDLDAGWVDFARVKTGVRRRIPLWPETVAAIREWLPMRPRAKDPADAGLMFLTVRGSRWVKVCKAMPSAVEGEEKPGGAPKDAIAQEFDKVVRKLELKRPGVAFYAIRHGFETIAAETLDQIAVDAIMGHIPPGMAPVYTERNPKRPPTPSRRARQELAVYRAGRWPGRRRSGPRN